MVYGAMLSTTCPIAAHSQMPAAITLAGWKPALRLVGQALLPVVAIHSQEWLCYKSDGNLGETWGQVF